MASTPAAEFAASTHWIDDKQRECSRRAYALVHRLASLPILDDAKEGKVAFNRNKYSDIRSTPLGNRQARGRCPPSGPVACKETSSSCGLRVVAGGADHGSCTRLFGPVTTGQGGGNGYKRDADRKDRRSPSYFRLNPFWVYPTEVLYFLPWSDPAQRGTKRFRELLVAARKKAGSHPGRTVLAPQSTAVIRVKVRAWRAAAGRGGVPGSGPCAFV